MNEDAKIVLKLHLCNSFIETLAAKNLITERQRSKLRVTVKRRIMAV